MLKLSASVIGHVAYSLSCTHTVGLECWVVEVVVAYRADRLHQQLVGNQVKSKMATLVSGQQYGLSSQANSSSQKSLVFVKLTDTALRAIEEYTRNKVSTSLQYLPVKSPQNVVHSLSTIPFRLTRSSIYRWLYVYSIPV